MTDDKHKPDAGTKAPRPERPSDDSAASRQQDAPNYADRTDGGRALPNEEVNSANDE